jgi:hypothetical protein
MDDDTTAVDELWRRLAAVLNELEAAGENPSPRTGDGWAYVVGGSGAVRWDADTNTWITQELY